MMDIYDDFQDDDDFDTVLSSDVEFTGELGFEKSFLVRGRMTGGIDAEGVLMIDEGAEVEADIKADKVIIKGRVKGNVRAKRVDILAEGWLDGDITADEVGIETGSRFNGRCLMPPSTSASTPG
jgi:cytoskeletal protein CcmA (bactofilin family)